MSFIFFNLYRIHKGKLLPFKELKKWFGSYYIPSIRLLIRLWMLFKKFLNSCFEWDSLSSCKNIWTSSSNIGFDYIVCCLSLSLCDFMGGYALKFYGFPYAFTLVSVVHNIMVTNLFNTHTNRIYNFPFVVKGYSLYCSTFVKPGLSWIYEC